MDGKIVIGTEIDTKSFDTQIEQIEKELNFVEGMLEKKKEYKLSTEAVEKFSLKAEKLRNQLIDLRKKQDALNKQGYSNMISSLGNIGNSMNSIIKKVSRWALAIFGVRSAYMFVRQSMSTLSQYDEQLATDMEYMRWALATTIKPIIEWIIKAVYTLLGVIGSIAKSLFNVNIFANAGADAFKRAKSNLGGANKEAKQLQKTLAGFDEMNVLQADGSITGGGGGGIPTPQFSLDDMFNNKDVKNVKKFWEDIFNFWEKDWKEFINTLDGNWKTFFEGIITFWKGIWDILKGYGEIIIGLIQMIFGVVTGNFDLVKQGFNILLEGIKNLLVGFFEMVEGTLSVVFGFIKGIFMEIWDVFYKYVIKPISNGVGQIGNLLKKPFQAMIDFIKKLWDNIKKPIESLVKNINKALDKVNPINILGDLGKGIGKGIGSIGKFFGFAKGGVVVPKLAKGAIANQPGRGIPTLSGGARWAEAGAEGYLPLTDSQIMSTLGQEIGKNVIINLTNVTKLDSRQIARKVDKVQQNNDFVLNR